MTPIDLSPVARGELSPGQTLSLIQKVFDEDEKDPSEAVHAALRDLVWRMLMTRSNLGDFSEWHHVVGHFGRRIDLEGHSLLSSRTLALSELISQTDRFLQLQSVDHVVHQRKVLEVNAIVGRNGDTMRLGRLAEEMGQSIPSTMDVLNIMSIHGFVSIIGYGTDANVVLVRGDKR